MGRELFLGYPESTDPEPLGMSVYTKRGLPEIANRARGKPIYFTGQNCIIGVPSFAVDGDFNSQFSLRPEVAGSNCVFPRVNGGNYIALVVPLQEFIHVKQVVLYFNENQWAFRVWIHDCENRHACVNALGEEEFLAPQAHDFYQVMCDHVKTQKIHIFEDLLDAKSFFYTVMLREQNVSFYY